MSILTTREPDNAGNIRRQGLTETGHNGHVNSSAILPAGRRGIVRAEPF